MVGKPAVPYRMSKARQPVTTWLDTSGVSPPSYTPLCSPAVSPQGCASAHSLAFGLSQWEGPGWSSEGGSREARVSIHPVSSLPGLFLKLQPLPGNPPPPGGDRGSLLRPPPCHPTPHSAHIL